MRTSTLNVRLHAGRNVSGMIAPSVFGCQRGGTPTELPEGAVYKVRHGEAIEFTLGAGAPLFPPRGAHRGLIVYITVCEADEGVRHIGEVMQSVHAELTREDSVVGIVKSFDRKPVEGSRGQHPRRRDGGAAAHRHDPTQQR